MPWVKLDDHFDENPKVARLSDAALALWVTGLAYSNRNLTDGFIPTQVGRGKLRYCDGGTDSPIGELESADLWDPVDGGWLIHDFTDYQPTRDQVLAEREAARERKAKSRRKSREPSQDESQRDASATSSRVTPSPVPVPDSEPDPPLPSVEEIDESLILDESRSDPNTGLEVWIDEDGKVRQTIDGLWDAACAIWGTPKTKTERGKRNREISELREAGLHPDLLEPLFAKAVTTWNGKRPGVMGIVRNLGDLLEGIEVSQHTVEQYQQETRRRDRRRQMTGGSK